MPTVSNPHIEAALVEAERWRLAPEEFASQYEAQFTGSDVYPCDRCGGPREGAPCVVSFHENEEPATCRDCGKLVGEDGLTRVSLVNGQPHATIIYFVRPRPPEIPPPGGVTRVLQLEDTPAIPDPPESWGADKMVVIHTPTAHREGLPDGIE